MPRHPGRRPRDSMFVNHGTLSPPRQYLRLGDRLGPDPALRKNQPCPRLDHRPPASMTGRPHVSVASNYPVCGTLLQQPREPETLPEGPARLSTLPAA